MLDTRTLFNFKFLQDLHRSYSTGAKGAHRHNFHNIFFSFFRLPVEGNAGGGEAALLRAAGGAEQAPHGAAPRLPLPPAAQAHLHRGREEAEDLRVQGAHTEPEGGDEAVLDRGGQAADGPVKDGIMYPCHLTCLAIFVTSKLKLFAEY